MKKKTHREKVALTYQEFMNLKEFGDIVEVPGEADKLRKENKNLYFTILNRGMIYNEYIPEVYAELERLLKKEDAAPTGKDD